MKMKLICIGIRICAIVKMTVQMMEPISNIMNLGYVNLECCHDSEMFDIDVYSKTLQSS